MEVSPGALPNRRAGKEILTWTEKEKVETLAARLNTHLVAEDSDGDARTLGDLYGLESEEEAPPDLCEPTTQFTSERVDASTSGSGRAAAAQEEAPDHQGIQEDEANRRSREKNKAAKGPSALQRSRPLNENDRTRYTDFEIKKGKLYIRDTEGGKALLLTGKEGKLRILEEFKGTRTKSMAREETREMTEVANDAGVQSKQLHVGGKLCC